MESALIVSYTDKGTEFFTELLSAASIHRTVSLKSCGEARRLLLERDFGLVIVNAPLPDESGESLARHIAGKGLSQVILAVRNEHFDTVSAACEDYGVLAVAKPLHPTEFWAALSLAKAAYNRQARAQSEDERLKQRIEDIRVADRAKQLLIAHKSMDEREAHRYIEKQAMNARITKRAAAEKIIKTYEKS